jgi:hypothetical protein
MTRLARLRVLTRLVLTAMLRLLTALALTLLALLALVTLLLLFAALTFLPLLPHILIPLVLLTFGSLRLVSFNVGHDAPCVRTSLSAKARGQSVVPHRTGRIMQSLCRDEIARKFSSRPARLTCVTSLGDQRYETGDLLTCRLSVGECRQKSRAVQRTALLAD